MKKLSKKQKEILLSMKRDNYYICEWKCPLKIEYNFEYLRISTFKAMQRIGVIKLKKEYYAFSEWEVNLNHELIKKL